MRRVYIGKFSHHVRERDIERFFRQEGKIREVLMKEGFAFVEFEHTTDAEAAVKHLDGRDLNGDRVHVEFAKGPPRTPRDGMRGGSMGMGGRGLSRRDGPPRRDFRNDRGGSGRDRGDRDDSRSGGRSGGGSSSVGGGISYAEKYGPPRNTDYRVIVENLSSRVSWQDLKDLMRQAGEVTFADAHKRERNMGIVDFASLKDMLHAIDTLNDTDFHGRRIKIYEDKSIRRRGPGGGSGGSGRDFGGRRSGGRSRSRSPRRYSSSRSRSRDRPVSRSRSPIARDRDAPSRSRSVSTSPVARRKSQRSRSRSRSRDSPQSERRQSRSRSISRSRSRSRSASPAESPVERKTRSRSRSASSSRSHDSGADNKRTKNNNNNNDDSNKLSGGDYDRRRSGSRSRSRDVSRSPPANSKKARLSASPKSPVSEHAED
uniref:Serine/arginine-rich splicing factor 4 n=1 Tax=Aceria tosichella TaxID=561515 RepID=A0A6G1S5I8_9ACAR